VGKRRTFSQYRLIDLVLFAVITVIFEVIVSKAARVFPSQPYSISIVSAVTCIVFMRWGLYGCFHAVLGGFVTCYATGGSLEQYVIYVLGNTFSVLAVLYLNKIGSDRVRNSAWLSVFMAGLVALLMQIGRGIVAVILGNSLDIAVGFILGDVLSGVFAMVIVGIARKLDGVFEDQKHYLLRINREEKELEEGFDEG
jgi:hypothetical protein